MDTPVRVLKVSRLEHFVDFLLLEALERRGRKLRQSGFPVVAARVNDEIGRAIAVQGLYEKHLLYAIASFLLPRAVPDALSATALDVGANIGNHSMFFAKYFAKVVAIEPNPNAALLLQANLAANGIANVELQQVGLLDQGGSLRFVEEQFNLGASRFVSDEDVETSAAGRSLPVMRGDDLVKALKLSSRVALIKLDVEGLETRVLLGLRETISRDRPLVLFEAWTGKSAAQIADCLRGAGYGFFYSIDRRRILTGSKWMRRMHRILAGADLYLQQVDKFGEWGQPLAAASCSPIPIR